MNFAAGRRGSEADTSALEREIDQIVYKLYGLTPEEIAIVEGAVQDETDEKSGTSRKSKPRLEKARSV